MTFGMTERNDSPDLVLCVNQITYNKKSIHFDTICRDLATIPLKFLNNKELKTGCFKHSMFSKINPTYMYTFMQCVLPGHNHNMLLVIDLETSIHLYSYVLPGYMSEALIHNNEIIIALNYYEYCETVNSVKRGICPETVFKISQNDYTCPYECPNLEEGAFWADQLPLRYVTPLIVTIDLNKPEKIKHFRTTASSDLEYESILSISVKYVFKGRPRISFLSVSNEYINYSFPGSRNSMYRCWNDICILRSQNLPEEPIIPPIIPKNFTMMM